jgi:hypothetical protein
LIAVQNAGGAPEDLVAQQLPYDQWVFTADAAVLPRAADGSPVR